MRIERHSLGPRLYVLGRRVHEWHLGAALIATALAAVPLGAALPALALGAVGVWLVAKDWHDLFPSRRDTTAWRLALHRAPLPLRPGRRADWLPPLAGALAIAVGAMNVASALLPASRFASALTPDPHGRARLLMQLLPEAIPRAAHAFALPAGAALLVIGRQLARRSRRAWTLALSVLVAAGALNVLKGLDVYEALACWGVAGVLVAARPAFCVGPEAGPMAAARQAALIALSSLAVAFTALFAASHWATPGTTPARAAAEIAARATWASGPLRYHEDFGWVPTGIDAILLCALLGVAYVVFRPLAHAREFPTAGARRAAAAIVRKHGHDTLSSFKLRPDKHYLFSADQRAFVGYAVEGRRLIVSGDPVGPDDALPGLLRELCGFAQVRSLKLASVGASESFAELARQAGLRSFYIGDEAIVDTRAFSLDGRRIRKVRQSVARIERSGYSAELADVGALDDDVLTELERRADEWRGDDVERGFSMATASIAGVDDGLVLVARDAGGKPAGLLHFVRCYGREAVSLGLMRRDRTTPNGLTEFMIVRAIDAFRSRGIAELSLNFAPFARLIHSPAAPHERFLGRIAVAADRFFQIERLYRFNAKFQPRWAPRYVLYEGRLGLPATGLAVMWAEHQLPKPRLAPRLRAALPLR